MKRFLGVLVASSALLILVGVAAAHWGQGPGQVMPGAMGRGRCAGREMMGARHLKVTATQLTEEKAKELAQQYADKYLAGFKVERVLPFTGMRHPMYSVELKDARGELRTVRITPFGGVMPFSGPAGRS